MKSAKEMFEELGYKQNFYKRYMTYETIGRIYYFDLINKYFFVSDNYYNTDIDMPTLKAIIKQCKELG